MSATASIRPIDGAVRRSSKDQRPGVGRLIAVELRKMVNTRSGFWVPIAVTGLTLFVSIIAASNHGGRDGTFSHVLHAASIPGAYLLPVMGVLLLCGEWSQRTTLSTFTLVICLLFTVFSASVFGHHVGGTGSLSWQVIAQSWLFLASGMVMGLAFGAAILVSAPAIVGYLLLPLVWSGIVENISGLAGVARWLDSGNTLGPLTEQSLSGTQWAHALATFALWIGAPLVIGLLRIGRGDID